MQPPEWIFPDSVGAALAELTVPGSLAVAGGTTVFDLLKLGHPVPARLIDLSRLPLKEFAETETSIVVGANVSNSDAAYNADIQTHFPAVSEAILSGASRQIRNAATIGGNLLQATRCLYFRDRRWHCNRRKPGSGCSALSAPQPGHAILGTTSRCIAVHPSDLAVALTALDAAIVGESAVGPLRLPIADFYKLPDDEWANDCALVPGTLMTSVELPKSPMARYSGYLKLRHRASYEFASASVAAAMLLKDGKVDQIALALGGVATMPWRDRDAESDLLGEPLNRKSIDLFCDRLLDGAVTSSNTAFKVGLVRGGIHRLVDRLAAMQRVSLR